MTSPWTLLTQPSKGGLRFFSHATDKRLAVADHSGDYPDETEDGIVWLLSERPTIVTGMTVELPVLVERTKEHGSTIATVREVIWLVEAGHIKSTSVRIKARGRWRQDVARLIGLCEGPES